MSLEISATATISTTISQLKQSKQDLASYYQTCKKLRADINANLLANDDTRPCVKILMVNYEAMITNAFMDGLPDHLSSLTRIYRPKKLQEAYQGLDVIEVGMDGHPIIAQGSWLHFDRAISINKIKATEFSPRTPNAAENVPLKESTRRQVLAPQEGPGGPHMAPS